jgi:arylsulfatase A-like enzyme
VGALIDGLAARRDLDEVLVIVIADHGECFERGSYFDHADCLSEGATRIPLLVRWPPGFARGARVATPASAVDVAPSVLRALGLDVPEGLSGVPLQELSAPRFVMVQHPFYQPEAAQERSRLRREIRSVAGDPIAPLLVDAERVGIVGSDFEYFVTGGRAELHALASPAAERENLAASRPELRARLDAILADELARHPMRIVDPGRIHPELLETLRALGYAEE